jgi:hypothetical protein
VSARDRRIALGLAAVFAALAAAAGLAGFEAALTFVMPVAGVVLPLLLGCYPGERVIAALARRPRARLRPRRSLGALPRPSFDHVPRGTSLMARSLAVRPPPLVPA